jgi:hypothetical protein
MSPISRSGKRNNSLSKSVLKELPYNRYEEYQTTFGLMEGFSGKLDSYNDHKICKMLPLNNIDFRNGNK